MAERIYRSSDIPDLDTYPSAPPDRQAGWTDVERSSVERSSVDRPSLEQRAAELGAAAGKIVFIVRQTKERVEKLAHQGPIRDRVTGLAENAKVRAEHLRQVAAARAQEWTHAAQARTTELGRQASEKTADLARQAKSRYFQARDRANQTVREYPVHTVLAAGAVGFLLGVGLRIRRTRRAY
jgi:ElaB/YqjD/DUF883 family membrane-anchored ribosome-binding protein